MKSVARPASRIGQSGERRAHQRPGQREMQQWHGLPSSQVTQDRTGHSGITMSPMVISDKTLTWMARNWLNRHGLAEIFDE